MNKLKLLLILLIPISIKAQCTNNELARYKSLASNIDSYYEYDNNFDVTIYNLSSELKIVNKNDNSTYTNPSGIGEIKIGNINPGTSLQLAVYPNNGECTSKLRTMYINLPYLNQYYQDEICINNSNNLCSKWVNTSIYTHEQFVELVKKTQEEIIEPEPEKEEEKFSILEFLGDYYIYILLVIIISGSIGIHFLNKKHSFDF